MTPEQFTDLIAGMTAQFAMHKVYGKPPNVHVAIARTQEVRPKVVERARQFLADVERIVMERAT